MATNDGKVKGVYAIELGALRFGDSKYSKGGGATYSGDGVNIETRWAYTDIALPTANKNRVIIGLQPFTVNKFVWSETVMGVQLKGDAGPVAYTAAWMRGRESFNDDHDDSTFEDNDALMLRGDFKPTKDIKAGVFALYQGANSDDEGSVTDFNTVYEMKQVGNAQYSIYTIGTDGSVTFPAGGVGLFVNWDAAYQGGHVGGTGNDLDLGGYFGHADLGVNLGKVRLTYTGWYVSGDDDATDGDIDNFMATDVDFFDSVIFFEGGYTDDNYFTEAPYFLNKGAIFNKLAADFKANDKLSLGAAVMYVMTAEDLPNGEDKLGTEIDAHISYKLYPNVELAVNAGYLFSDDGMDNFTATGSADDIFRTTARVRYSF